MSKLNLKFIIFSLIGVFNTLFDLVLYVILLKLTGSIIIANTIATAAALIGSYLLNSKLTFRATQWTTKSFVSFVAVTLFGLWVLQTGLIYGFDHLLRNVAVHSWWRPLLPKLLATGFTFIWNYIWYNKVIFKDQPKPVSLVE